MAPKSKAKVAAKAKKWVHMRRALRRPGQAGWERGDTVSLHQLDPREVRQWRGLIEEGYYYHQQVQVAGLVTEVVLDEESFSLT